MHKYLDYEQRKLQNLQIAHLSTKIVVGRFITYYAENQFARTSRLRK
ncbi:hypothetical protein [Finegoldia magna]|nr:hypothetical protein [Finegoldia magna]